MFAVIYTQISKYQKMSISEIPTHPPLDYAHSLLSSSMDLGEKFMIPISRTVHRRRV